ncbi:MAG: 3-octaprenyl-4-hydroxybenzoate decarboxylase [Nitrospirae bacterium RIFCSPLOW2_12_42_9]|nr:MAG: 3-octaprenyl-4-hydroxybenzoate decarboxylase [Nitrospirae bacterium RIFCSPLOW2_12_42_9]
MPYNDLRDFINNLEKKGELVRIKTEVSPYLEITEILERLLLMKGPAVLFENVKGFSVPVVANLYGTIERVALGLESDEEGLEEIGTFLAYLQHPEPPKGLIEAIKKLPFFAKIMSLTPKTVNRAPCQEVIIQGDDVDLSRFPIMTCWPGDVAPLITWPLVITQSPSGGPYNVGVYRMQVIGKNKTIMRWLKTRGGAQHYREWMERNTPMPVSVAIGCEPATTIAAVTPVPERVGEFHFAGLLRKEAIELVQCMTNSLMVPATSEIVLEGEILPGEEAQEGPFADHTGYYNAEEHFPVFRVKCITHRSNPLYLSTITGRPPKEDAIIALALTKIFLPLLRNQFPEIMDFHLPMEAVSYRIAVVSIKKEFPGHAKRVMMGLWGFLKQFLYVKYIIVVDDDIDVRKWDDVIWALSTRVDPGRDTTIIENTPFDYLDFSTPLPELGAKMGIDATMKSPPEVNRAWGKKVEMANEIKELVDKKWPSLNLERPR